MTLFFPQAHWFFDVLRSVQGRRERIFLFSSVDDRFGSEKNTTISTLFRNGRVFLLLRLIKTDFYAMNISKELLGLISFCFDENFSFTFAVFFSSGFSPAFPLLIVGLGSFGLAIFATVVMILKFVVCRQGHQREIDAKLLVFFFIEFGLEIDYLLLFQAFPPMEVRNENILLEEKLRSMFDFVCVVNLAKQIRKEKQNVRKRKFAFNFCSNGKF